MRAHSGKIWAIWVHTTQGNDLGNWLEDTKTPSHAFAEWGRSFREHEKQCVALANALEGTTVTAHAQGEAIHLLTHSAADDAALEKLAEGGGPLFRVDDDFEPWWDDEPTDPDIRFP